MKSLLDLFLKKSTCAHAHALINTNEGYCPDCGAYLKKYFCGSKDYYIEKLDTISFIDIPYAIHTKEVIVPEQIDIVSAQIWVDENKTKPVKFLTGSV